MNSENREVDNIGDKIPLHVLLGCSPKVSFVMDQWVVCFIECRHGKFRSSANGLNMGQAFDRSVAKVIEAHPRCGIIHDFSYANGETVQESCDKIALHDGEHEFY